MFSVGFQTLRWISLGGCFPRLFRKLFFLTTLHRSSRLREARRAARGLGEVGGGVVVLLGADVVAGRGQTLREGLRKEAKLSCILCMFVC